MRLSVIIPYYNSNTWIDKALNSLLDQDLDPSEYEIIVVDDGSDEEPNVLNEYVSRFPIIRYYRIEHVGLSSARNTGMALAQGDWLYFCDSDDYVQARVLGSIIAVAEGRESEMICARRVLVTPSDVAPVPRRNFSEVLEFQTGMEYFGARTSSFSWGVWPYLLRRSVVSLFHLSFEDINYVEDRLFLLNLLSVVKRVTVIDVDLYYYVQHESSISHSIRKKHGTDFIDAWLVFMDYLHSLRDDPSISRQVAARLQELGYDASFTLFMNACRYCPIDVTKQSFISLSAMGFYPIEASFYGRARFYKNLINHKGLWLLLCRILHLLPMSLRVHM